MLNYQRVGVELHRHLYGALQTNGTNVASINCSYGCQKKLSKAHLCHNQSRNHPEKDYPLVI